MMMMMMDDTSSQTTTDLWYQYFMGDPWHVLILIGIYGLRAFWATLGILCNYGVVYITIRNKSLHSVCNILIALESFLAIFQDASYFISFAVVISGFKFIRYANCFPMLVPLALCGEAAQITMLFTGIDRLLSVLFPVWYKKRNSRWYLTFAGAFIGTYATYAGCLYFVDYSRTQEFLLSCSTNEMGQSGIGSVMKVDGIVLSVLLMTVYGLVWFMVFFLKATSKTVSGHNRRIIKSLIAIIAFNLVGVCFKSSVQLVFKHVQVSPFLASGFSTLFSFFTIAVYSANAPVLFIMSSEYRRQFHKHFKFVAKITFNKFPPINQVTPMQQTGFIKSIANSSSHHLFVRIMEQNRK